MRNVAKARNQEAAQGRPSNGTKSQVLSWPGNQQDKVGEEMDKKREELQKKGKEFRETAEDATADFRKKLAEQAQPDKFDLKDSKRIEKLAEWGSSKMAFPLASM